MADAALRQMLMGTGATVRAAAAAVPKGELRAGACLLQAPAAAIGDADDVAQDLAASTITLYPSDTAERRIGRLIAISSDYICYAVKAGHIRALYRHSPVRALLRGHTANAVDLQCCGGDEFSLVSAGKDGAIIFWKIAKSVPDDGSEAQLTPEIVGQLMHPDREEGDADLFYTSVRYHPSVNDGRGAAPVVVALDTRGKVALWHGAYESREPVELACAEEGAVFTAIAISPDGTTIAAATSEGMVVVWNAGAAGFAVAKQWKAHSASVFSLTFGPASASVSMISATSAGEMKVWDPSWNCRQTVSFTADTYDRVATTCANEVLFLASSKSSSLVACHVGKSGLLDHAAKCNIGQPVLSFTAETDADSIGIFGVQTSAIQQFTIATENCLPPPGLVPEPAPAPAPEPANAPSSAPQASTGGGLLSPNMVKGTAARPVAAAAAAPASGVESAEIAAAMARLASGIDETQNQVGQAMAAVSARVDAGFQQFIAAHAKQQAKQQAEREQQNAALKQQILEGIAPVIRKELKSALPPLIKSSMQEVTSQVILPAIQQSARDSTGSVATAVVGNLQGPMQDSFRAGIISAVLPALEGAIQQAFATVNDTLEQGLTTCLKEPVEVSLQQIQTTVQRIASSSPYSQSAGSGSTEGEAAAPDPKAVIDSLLQSENYEQAFVEALSARSVPLIIWMLEKLDPSEALSNLTQVVLISLVQQLGHDMSDDIDIKLTYLHEAALHLDKNDATIAEHVGPVLTEVNDNITAATEGYSTEQTKKSKIVKMMLQGL